MSSEINWLIRLAKWRTVFAGWQLGTRVQGDAEADAVRDHRELSLALRAELSAVTALLLAKGVFTRDEYDQQVQECAEALCRSYERRFPGFKAVDDGIAVDLVIARDTMAGWRD
jgi:hypothetical protein